MKPDLRPGMIYVVHSVVAPDMTIDFLTGVTPTLSTPAMIMLMEGAARLLLEPLLDTGQSSVGVVVHVRHLAPTPLGMAISASATLKHVEGRRCLFAIECHDERETLGEGEHERFVIDVARFAPRVAAKVERGRGGLVG